MPRQARIDIAGVPLHITQRGVNRCAVFIDDDDRQYYLGLLEHYALRFGLGIHAYVLMGNHIHLLASSERAGTASTVLKRVNLNYVAAFNRRHGRTGTLWEGRFRSCLVDSDSYILTVYRYIDLNPVRAAITEKPDDYPWSSASFNLGLNASTLLTPHTTFLALASEPDAYRHWLYSGVSEAELVAIRLHTKQERAYGDRRFQAMVEKALGRPVAARPPCRPRKENTRHVDN